MGRGRDREGVSATSAPTATPPPTLPDLVAHLGFSQGLPPVQLHLGGRQSIAKSLMSPPQLQRSLAPLPQGSWTACDAPCPRLCVAEHSQRALPTRPAGFEATYKYVLAAGWLQPRSCWQTLILTWFKPPCSKLPAIWRRQKSCPSSFSVV